MVAWGSLSTWRRGSRETLVLATTECSFSGEPRVTIAPDVPPADLAPVRAHEGVHEAQCRALGPWRYRWANLSAAGRLSLEAPAYCAGAAERIRAGESPVRVERRLMDDATEALRGVADSAAVVSALQAACPAILRRAPES